jgi:hypothetical protein
MFFVNSAVIGIQYPFIARAEGEHTRSIATSFLFQVFQFCLEDVKHIGIFFLSQRLHFGISGVSLHDKVNQLNNSKMSRQLMIPASRQSCSPGRWKIGLPRSSSSLGTPHAGMAPTPYRQKYSAKCAYSAAPENLPVDKNWVLALLRPLVYGS